jgi:hypothetical protein
LIDTTSPIGADELRELEALYRKLPALRRIAFAEVLTTPHLIKPLRRTLDAQKRSAENYQLTPPPAPAVTGSEQTSSSGSEQRAVAVSRPRRPHAWDARR